MPVFHRLIPSESIDNNLESAKRKKERKSTTQTEQSIRDKVRDVVHSLYAYAYAGTEKRGGGRGTQTDGHATHVRARASGEGRRAGADIPTTRIRIKKRCLKTERRGEGGG